jgi:hypothetical protein
MSCWYEKRVEELRAEGFAPILLVSARTRPDLAPSAGEFRFHFPSAEDAETQTAIYSLVKRALFEEHVRETVQAALPGSEGESAEEQAKRARELARLRRRHENN